MIRRKDLFQEKHDVFISFRQDTHKTFTSHLRAALTRTGINTCTVFNFERGEDILATIFKNIEEAKLSLVVFSKNYANSELCLDELVKILECKKKKDQMVVPVFYDVDPNIVREQMGSYEEAFAIHEQKFKGNNMKKVQSWRNALTKASSYAGWDCTINRTEHEIVEEIAKTVLEKLDRVYVGDMDLQIEKLEQLARLQEEFSEKVFSSDNQRNYEATLERIKRVKMEKKLKMLHRTPHLLAHMEISKAYF